MENFSKDDYIVLKYDLDINARGVTYEWGWLRYFLDQGGFDWVDELYIELHFRNTKFWRHHDWHSMWEGFDFLRSIRRCGYAIHTWP